MRRRCSAASRSSGAGDSGWRRENRRSAQPRHGSKRPGLLGEVLSVLGCRTASGADRRRLTYLTADERRSHCDENTIGVVAVMGSTYDGSYEPVRAIAVALDEFVANPERRGRPDPRRRSIGGIRRPLPRPRAGVGLPPAACPVHQHARDTSTGSCTQASAGSSGATRTRCPTTSSSTSTTSAATCRRSRSTSHDPGRRVVAQYYNFLRLGTRRVRQVQRRAGHSP